MARLLGMSDTHYQRYERDPAMMSARKPPKRIVQLVQAFNEGYRPKGWPRKHRAKAKLRLVRDFLSAKLQSRNVTMTDKAIDVAALLRDFATSQARIERLEAALRLYASDCDSDGNTATCGCIRNLCCMTARAALKDDPA
jgi:ribosomal protein L31E